MKNVNYSTIYFSAFSPNILLTPVQNRISPLNSSVKKIIKEKNLNNKRIYKRASFSDITNINTLNKIQKKIDKIYKDKKQISDSAGNIDINHKQKKLKSFYTIKPIKKEERKKKENLFGKDFIIIAKTTYHPLMKKCKSQKFSAEPYKKYLYEKNVIEKNKKAKEIEMNYIIEAKRQKKIKMETDIRNKYQGLDFSKQKKRECLKEYSQSKNYAKNEKNKNNDENLYSKYLMKKLQFEMYEKKYLFLENNGMIPRVRYTYFDEKLNNFMGKLKKNPICNARIRYLSKNN